jgi:dethiobiotin synthetase
LRGLFVAGTDTGVGKSVVAAAACAALAVRGERVAAFKPAVTGLDDDPGAWGADHELLSRATGGAQRPEEVAPYTFGPPASPHYAAELEGKRIDPADLVSHARALSQAADSLVCEGVGGLLVPITPGYLVRDLAVDLGLPVVVVARPGLGTINHTLLTVEAARAAGLGVSAVVMTPWPEGPAALESSNQTIVERIAAVRVTRLGRVHPERLAEAGGSLPVDEWMSGGL